MTRHAVIPAALCIIIATIGCNSLGGHNALARKNSSKASAAVAAAAKPADAETKKPAAKQSASELLAVGLRHEHVGNDRMAFKAY